MGCMRIGRMDVVAGAMVMRVEMGLPIAVIVPLAQAVVDVIDMAHRLRHRLGQGLGLQPAQPGAERVTQGAIGDV